MLLVPKQPSCQRPGRWSAWPLHRRRRERATATRLAPPHFCCQLSCEASAVGNVRGERVPSVTTLPDDRLCLFFIHGNHFCLDPVCGRRNALPPWPPTRWRARAAARRPWRVGRSKAANPATCRGARKRQTWHDGPAPRWRGGGRCWSSERLALLPCRSTWRRRWQHRRFFGKGNGGLRRQSWCAAGRGSVWQRCCLPHRLGIQNACYRSSTRTNSRSLRKRKLRHACGGGDDCRSMDARDITTVRVPDFTRNVMPQMSVLPHPFDLLQEFIEDL